MEATESATEALKTERSTFVDLYPRAARVVRAALIVAFTALGIGGLFGFIQALHRSDTFRGIIDSPQYYTMLTGHGVLLALVFTFMFTVGIFLWAVTRSLEREPENMTFTWTWFGIATGGVLLTTFTILAGFVPGDLQANVLYTFYPPMQAHPLFYIGLVLLVAGIWLAGVDWFRTYWTWRAENPEARIPLQVYMVLFTMLLWYLATIGVTIEIVGLLLPWSMGWMETIDASLGRTLFWYFGHALVYFWLMPAYMVWYTILPTLSGGRLFSDSLGRIVFLLFLVLSVPIGFHHQYTDPGISTGLKMWAMLGTMMILLPSLLTLFTVIASMEHGARQRGGTGYFAWLGKLPWDRPAFVGCALAGLMFAGGGFSGMVNASMNLNTMVHNTIWQPGHFHLTVGTAVGLTFMAVSYWLLPQLTGRELRFKKLALFQPYAWFVGMTLMSNSWHRGGMAGIPRRTAEPEYAGFDFEAVFGTIGEIQFQVALGATILTISVASFIIVMIGTWWNGQAASVNDTLRPALSGPEHAPKVLDNMKLWFGLAAVLALLAYGLPIGEMFMDPTPGSPPFPM